MTVYSYFREWKQAGVYARLNDTLPNDVRQRAGRNAVPTAGIIDSQSVKTSEKGGSKGTTAGRRSKVASAI